MTRNLTPFDFPTPFYRNSVGIKRLGELFAKMEDDVANATNYPPYNIIDLGEDKHRVEVAVAGFSQDDIVVTVEDGVLKIEGSIEESEEDEGPTYVHRGLAGRKFRRNFELVDYVEVTSATLKDGILVVDLERIIPDALKPKQIEVKVS